MSEDIRSDSLNAHVKGKGKYLAFREETFVQKSNQETIQSDETIH